MGLAQRKQEVEQKVYTPKQKLRAMSIINADHSYFSEKVLKIYNTEGELVPFIKNRAQREFGKVWDECIRRFGYVRIVCVKARKRGISTEVAGRFVHGMVKAEAMGLKCDSLVLAHDDASSTALFGITKNMVKNMGDFSPRLVSDSMHRLDTNISSYLCMTAGKQKDDGSGKGRAMTPKQVHISEVSHINNAQTLASSVIAATPCVAGTVIVMETTANGEGDYFHGQYLAAKRGETDFLPFFAPWFWDDDNQCDIQDGFTLTSEDEEYRHDYGLTMRQMAWRRFMENKLGLTEEQGRLKFKTENPANDIEAFSYSATESYISVNHIKEALERSAKQQGPDTAVIAAYDPSNKGKDRDVFVLRHGTNVFGLEMPAFNEDDFDARVRFLQDKLDNRALNIDMLFMDAGGGGYQLRSRLNNLGYGMRVRWIEFGAGADNQLKAQYKRDEMFVDFNALLTDKHDPISIDIEEKHKQAFIVDLTATGYEPDHKNRPKMESKKSIKARLGISTDIADACIMLVAMPVRKRVSMQLGGGRIPKANSGYSPFS